MRMLKEPTSTIGSARGRSRDAAVETFLRDDLGVSATIAQVIDAFREVRPPPSASRDASDPAAEFSPEERAALERAGADFTPLPLGSLDPVERTRLMHGALLLDTLSVVEVATRLGRDASRIRQRIRDHTLWATAGEGSARLPRIQFDDDGSEIPSMGRVLQALPDDLHPVSVLGWLTRPNEDLRIDGTEVSPRDWLRAGGRADEPVALAEDLHAS